MKTTVKRAMALLAIYAMSALSGCSTCHVSCAAPHADLPATVAPNQTLTIEVKDLWICPEMCESTPVPMDNVTIEAVQMGTNDMVTAATATVNNQATAEVSLTIPGDAVGSLAIRTSGTGVDLGIVDVVKE